MISSLHHHASSLISCNFLLGFCVHVVVVVVVALDSCTLDLALAESMINRGWFWVCLGF